MKGRTLGITLVVAALILVGASAYLLRTGTNPEPEAHGDVTEPPKAPEWTFKKQESLPDYDSANSTVETDNATEAEKEIPVVEESAAPKPRVIEEDSVVSMNFLRAMARELVDGFTPARFSQSGSPHTTISFRKLNMRFGRNLEGFTVDTSDTLKAREAIFHHLITPDVAKGIFEDYQPVFIDTLEETARNTTKKSSGGQEYTLSVPELSDMFRVYGKQFHRTAAALKGAADPQIAETATRFIRARRATERANSAFQTAMADYEVGAKEVTVAGSRLKGAVKERERIKKLLVDALKRYCPSCDQEDLFYIAMWSYRRSLQSDNSSDFISTASNCLAQLAGSFDAKAAQLLEE